MTREDVHKARARAHQKYSCGEMELDQYLEVLTFLCELESDANIVDQNSPEVIIDARDFIDEKTCEAKRDARRGVQRERELKLKRGE